MSNEAGKFSPFPKNVISNFVTCNKVLNHCRVIDAIQKVFMNGLWIYQQQRIYLTENSMLCYGHWCQSWGGGRVHGAPTPSLGGLCPPGSAAYGIAVSELLMPLTIQVGDIIRRRPTVQPSARAKPPPSRRMMSHGIMR